MMLISGIILANNTPKHKVVGDLVKSTYFHDNKKISQEGFYKNGKVHGKWTSYNELGKVTAIAYYNEGVKTGNWMFLNKNELIKVEYSMNKIVRVERF